MSVVNVGYSRTQRWRIGSNTGVAVAVGVGVGLTVTVVSGVFRVCVVTGADTAGAEVVGTVVDPPAGPDESVHPAARRTAMARIAREKSVILLIGYRLYHDPIIFLFSFPRPGKTKKDPQPLSPRTVQG